MLSGVWTDKYGEHHVPRMRGWAAAILFVAAAAYTGYIQ
jgi:hypothetical protein